MMANELREMIAQAAGVPEEQVMLEHPEMEEHGDYSANIALELGGGRELAEKIKEQIERTKRSKQSELMERIEVAGPGFINFTLRPEVLVGLMPKAANVPQIGRGKTIVIDYSAPNIAKPFGIGHLRSTIIGQALYNIYQALGYKVIGDNHLGDWGTQFGKLLYMIDKTETKDLSIENLERLYVEFHQHPEWEEEGRKWFRKLEDGDEEARRLWQKCVEVSLVEFERIYTRLGVEKIDYAYGESFYEDKMPAVIQEAKKRKIAIHSQGAWVIEVPGQPVPLMLLKSDGSTTYAARDLATLKFRRDEWDPDMVIYEVSVEQTLHFLQVFAAARKLGYVRDDTQLVHTKHGWYLGEDGKKFSTRRGKTIKLEEVLEEAISRAKQLGSGDENTAQAVGVGAIKYFDLSHNIQSDIVFEWEKIMALEGNSGPYLQYTYARTQSVLRKAGNSPRLRHPSLKLREGMGVSYNSEELAVLRWIYRYGEVVEEAAKRYAPNLVCNFLYKLAQRFNSFYNAHRIRSHPLRLAMTKAVGEVLKSGLTLLGITPLEKM